MPVTSEGKSTVGRYRLGAVLGRGAMGIVHQAQDVESGALCAVKILSPKLAESFEDRERFAREARTIEALEHPNVVRISDHGETRDRRMFIVMELLQGETLAARIERGPYGIRRACDVAGQVAGALAYGHARGVVHRDLKPHNLFITDDELVKLLDFGLARVIGESKLTATGAVLGTPAYMAPEQAAGQPAAPAADVYALGCVLYALLTGRPPFSGGQLEVLRQHMRQEPPPPSLRSADAKPLDPTLLAMLQKDPADRPTALQVVALLQRSALTVTA